MLFTRKVMITWKQNEHILDSKYDGLWQMINIFLGCIWKWVSTTWWLYVFIRNMMIRSIVKFWEYSWFLHKVWLGQASDDDHREQNEGGECFDWHQQGAGRVFIDERRLGEEVQDEARHHVAFNGLTVRTVYKGAFPLKPACTLNFAGASTLLWCMRTLRSHPATSARWWHRNRRAWMTRAKITLEWDWMSIYIYTHKLV